MHEKEGRVYLLYAIIGFIGTMRSRSDVIKLYLQ